MTSRENTFHFYQITDQYVRFLQNIDKKIMNNRNESRSRVYLGVVFTIKEHKYFAPITSYKEEKHKRIKNSDQTCFIIYGTDRDQDTLKKLALLNLNNMFPVVQSELSTMEFDIEDDKYKDLLEKEYRFIISNQDQIIKKASKLYALRTTKNIKRINKLCCDFSALEREYLRFQEQTDDNLE